MKKTLGLGLLALLILSFANIVPVSAAWLGPGELDGSLGTTLAVIDAAVTPVTNVTLDVYDLGQTFTVNVSITNVVGAAAVQAGLSFDPAIVQAVAGPREGDWSRGAGTIWIPGAIDNGLGVVTASSSTTAPIVGNDYAIGEYGCVIQVDFQVVGEGLCIIAVGPNPATDCFVLDTLGSSLDFYSCDMLAGKTPPSPYSPTASFTVTPPAAGPYPGTWSFDASGSTAGFNGTDTLPITEYTWQWDDGTPDNVTTSPTITHEFAAEGTYNVNLTVYAPPGIPDFYYPYGSTVKPVTVLLPAPTSPVADFTFSPLAPYVDETVSFDAGASLPGFNGTDTLPITEYTWQWDDGTPDNVTTSPTITHEFAAEGTYNVNLTVYAPPGIPEVYYPYGSTVKPVTVYPPVVGALIDVYTQKEPYSGRGLNEPSDAFAPEEKVILYANVTYNLAPVMGRLVAYSVHDPGGDTVATGTAISNETGIATMSFRVPALPGCIFGTWSAKAVVEVAGKIVFDDLTFRVGWIVEILSLWTVNGDGQPQTEFMRGDCVGVELVVRNIAMANRSVTLAVIAYDESEAPIAGLERNVQVEPSESSLTFLCELQIPLWALVGTATVRANAYTAPLAEGGKPYCLEASATFTITYGRDVGVVRVGTSGTEVSVGETVSIFVDVKNLGSEAATFNVTAYCGDTIKLEKQTVTDLAPGSERTLTFSWDTSEVPEGKYTISAVASPVPLEIDEENNVYVDGVIEVYKSTPLPWPLSALTEEPLIIGLWFSVAAAIIVTITGILLWRRRRKVASPRFSLASALWALRA